MTTQTKPSGIDWIGDIPADWEVKKIGYMFSFGKGLSITKEDLQDGGIPCISYGEIHSKYGFVVDPTKNPLRCVEDKYLMTSQQSLLRYGDFIFADTSEDIDGSGNFTYLDSNEKVFAGYHTIIARAKGALNFRYIAYVFDSLPFRTQIRSKVSGIKVYSITQNIIKNVKFILPPLPEQTAIAAFLDTQCAKIDAVIADLNEQIDIMNRYKKAVITEAVTKGLDKNAPMKDSGVAWIGKIPEHWSRIKVKYLCFMQSGDNLTADDITFDGDYVVFGGNGIRGYYSNYNVDSKVILVGRQGALCGNVHRAEGKLWATDHAVVTRNFSNCDLDYLYYLLLSMNLNQYSEASAQPGLAVVAIQNISIVAPLTVKEQTQIVDYLDKKCAEIDAIIAEKQKSIATMQDYKKSVIYEYTTGKKRVKGVVA
jgi:type I restriction enzyme S subunit